MDNYYHHGKQTTAGRKRSHHQTDGDDYGQVRNRPPPPPPPGLQQSQECVPFYPVVTQSYDDGGWGGESSANKSANLEQEPSYLAMLGPADTYGYFNDEFSMGQSTAGGSMDPSLQGHQTANKDLITAKSALPINPAEALFVWTSKYLSKNIVYIHFSNGSLPKVPYTMETIYSVLESMELNPHRPRPSSSSGQTPSALPMPQQLSKNSLEDYTPSTLLKRWSNVENQKYQMMLTYFSKYNIPDLMKANINLISKNQIRKKNQPEKLLSPIGSYTLKYTVRGWTDRAMELDLPCYITKYIVCEYALEYAVQNPTWINTKSDSERANLDGWITSHRHLGSFISKLALGLAESRNLDRVSDFEFNTAIGVAAILLYLIRKNHRYEKLLDMSTVPLSNSLSKWVGICCPDIVDASGGGGNSYRCKFVCEELDSNFEKILFDMLPYISTYL
ncbi:hypothetical protein H4219_004260 [Mycoemilia scoparia]|uniref:Uncharacterized protein n=1 Tax=Mycoemilia scoparia TaxID=417184 RepID=A0A9W8DN45_9FUNG|nr:hypothetical protein H4219_004260 [Mycoemilia scoparia]